MTLTAERLREVLSYDAETGVFTWIKPTGKKSRPGKVAGCMANADRRVILGIDGKRYRAHRLAWLYVHGEWPALIDHINGDPADNRLCNLRLATRTQNQGNRVRNKNNSSGVKGVHWHAQSKKWCAKIRSKGKSRHIGLYATKEEAGLAYLAAAERMFGEFANNGER